MIKALSLSLLAVLLLMSCGQATQFKVDIHPQLGALFTLNDSILIRYQSSEALDSVRVNIDGKVYPIDIRTKQGYCKFNTRFGAIPYSVELYKNGNSQIQKRSFVNRPKPPKEEKIKVLKSHNRTGSPHTQGYTVDNGIIYESSGEYGKSYIHKVDPRTMKTIKRTNLESQYYGEGCAIIGDDLYVLSWRENTLLKFNKHSLELEQKIAITTDGWGLTTDGEMLYLSDGSQYIYTISPVDYSIKSKFPVLTHNGNLFNINEMEWIDGYIYANIFLTESIAKIDPKNGAVKTLYDASGLWEYKPEFLSEDLLNGIAFDSKTRKIYITGKKWDKVYEVEL